VKPKGVPAVKDTTNRNIDKAVVSTGPTNATPEDKSQPISVFVKASPGSCAATGTQISNAIIHKNWADKQCEAFAGWLNYTFQPSEDKDHESTVLDDKAEAYDTTKTDRAALRTLILHRRMAQVRAKASDLFTSENMKIVLRSIHAEVTRRRLKLREDRDMYADLTLRGQITSLLLSYSTPWLRLGLETIFGEVISPESPNHFSPQKVGFGMQGLGRKTETVRRC
jgi:abnormal spindle-like microcephaly-associated protein